MKVEVAVLDCSPSLIHVVRTVSVDIKQHTELEPGTLPELRSCVKVEVAVMDSPSLTVLIGGLC